MDPLKREGEWVRGGGVAVGNKTQYNCLPAIVNQLNM